MPRSYAPEEGSLSSMDMARDILECHKTLASEYTKAALESTAPALRRTFRQLGRDCERVAFHAWEVLHEQGHYPVKSAPQSECQQAQEMIDSFRRGLAVPNAQGSSANQRWGRPSNYGGAPERYGVGDRYSGGERYPAVTGDRYGAGADRDAPTERSERGELPEWARARI